MAFLKKSINQFAGDVLRVSRGTAITEYQQLAVRFESAHDHRGSALNLVSVRFEETSLNFEAFSDDGLDLICHD